MSRRGRVRTADSSPRTQWVTCTGSPRTFWSPSLPHLRQDPVDGRLQAARAGDTVAEPVHQAADPGVGGAVSGGGANQAVGGGAIGRGDVGGLTLGGAGKSQEEEAGEAQG